MLKWFKNRDTKDHEAIFKPASPGALTRLFDFFTRTVRLSGEQAAQALGATLAD